MSEKSENYIDESSSPRIVEAPRYGCTLSGAYEAAVGLNEGGFLFFILVQVVV
ncbi:hypothetical protein [Methanobrevibacter arboriphilus]|uniref:hypothetical protein n=1 Tax=Methanobrevibacter arboriphilus TaxID=39441 RepID=UPI0018D0A7BC|nr:hypothetical protein [Methanobrevibacter arboriphilus]